MRVGLALDSATFIAETRRVDASVNRLGRSVASQNRQMQRGFDAVSSSVKGFAASLGALVTVAAAVRLGGIAKDALDAAGNLGEMATAAGVTTRQLQGLQLAGVQVGVSSEQMVKALGQFGVRVGEARQGTGELIDTLKLYGIATANSSGQVRASVDILGDLANAVQSAGSEQEKLSIVADAFGSRVGPKLLPILTDGAAGFQKWAQAAEDAGLILDDEFIAAADRASDGIATLQFAIAKGFEIGVVEEFANAISVSADQIERARQVGEAFGRAIGKAMDVAVDALTSLQPFFETTVQEFNALANLLQRFFDFAGIPFDIAAQAAEGASESMKPLEVDIHKVFERTTELTEATRKLTAEQKRLAEAGKILTRTSAQEERFDHQAEAAAKAAKAMEDQTRAAERLADEQRRVQEQQATEAARLLNQPFENFLQSVQSATADTFEKILNGGVTTFKDLFETAKQLVIKFAAETAALLVFNPSVVLGAAGAFGAGGAPGTAGGPSLASLFGFGGAVGNPAAGGVRTGPGGLLVGGGVTSSNGVPASSFNLSGTLGAAGIGGLGGAVLGSQINGAGGALGGGIGGALGAGAGFVIGGPIGAAVGGTLGGVGGSFLGGLFGGGGGKNKVQGTFGGGIGSASFSGDREISNFVKQVDSGILALLNQRQKEIVGQLNISSQRIDVKGGLSDSDLQNIARKRIGAAGKALGFTDLGGGSAENQLKNLQTAIEVRRAVEDLTGSVGTFERQSEDLADQFADLSAKADRFGVSIDGLTDAQTKAAADLQKTQDAQIAALLDPFEALRDPLEALKAQLDFVSKNPAEQFKFAQADFERIAQEALGGDLSAFQDFAGAAQLFLQQADQFGASPAVASATTEIQSLTAQLLERLDQSQAEASEGIEDVISRASDAQIDKLDDLIDEVKKMAQQLKRVT